MWQRHTSLGLVLLALLAAAVPCAAAPLDPQPGFAEFDGEAAIRPNGEALLTWTRQEEPGGPWTAMAATLDPISGQLGEVHEWGAGGTEQVVSLGSGYLALRLNVNPNPAWFVQHLDASGRPVGAAVPLGFNITAAMLSTPGGGALVVAGGVTGTGGTSQAWRFGPDGNLLSGPVLLVDVSTEVGIGVDAAGNIILAWTDSGRLFARRFSPDLQPLGPVLNVALGGGSGPRLAVAPDGRFVVVFVGQGYRLYTRAYRADGSSLGQRRPFSTPSELVMPWEFDVAINEDGGILAVWKTYVNSTNVPVIRAQGLSLAGRPVGKVFRLAQLKGGRGELLRPSVESLPGGDFLVLWSRFEADGKTATLQSRRVAGR